MIIPRLSSFYHVANDPTADIKDKPLYIDTSFVIELLGGTGNDIVRQNECSNLYIQSITSGSLLCISPKVHEELRMAVVNTLLRNKARGQRIKDYARNNPADLAYAKGVVRKIKDALTLDPNWEHLEIPAYNHDFIENVVDPIFETTDLMFADSFHYAVARDQGIVDFVTLDDDYAYINDPAAHVIVDTGNYLKIYIENNLPVPTDVLNYYVTECTRLGMALPPQIRRYYTNLRRLTRRT